MYDGIRPVSQDDSLTVATLNDLPDLSPGHKLGVSRPPLPLLLPLLPVLVRHVLAVHSTGLHDPNNN